MLAGSLVWSLLAWIGFASAQTTPQSSNSQAVIILADIEASPFGTSRAQWRAKTPRASWREFQGDLPEGADRTWLPASNWCSIAHDSITSAIRREATFYPLQIDAPIDCRLEELRYEIAGGAEMHESVARVFQATYGEPQRFSGPEIVRQIQIADFLKYQPWTSPVFETSEARYWNWSTIRGGRRILIFPYRDTVQVIVRSGELYQFFLTPRVASTRSQLQLDLSNLIRLQLPRARDWVLGDGPVYETPDQREILDLSLQLLSSADKATSASERARLWLTTSLLLGRLHVRGRATLEQDPRSAALLRRGLKFIEREKETDVWTYDNGLRNDVIAQYPQIRWGQFAFVDRLEDPEGPGHCSSEEYFKEVIAQGPRWLNANPRSELATRVAFLVAEAYDTWWSLSRGLKNDVWAFDPEAYRADARTTQAQAITWYRRVLREAPRSPEAQAARPALIKLILGVDTGERAFYSPCD